MPALPGILSPHPLFPQPQPARMVLSPDVHWAVFRDQTGQPSCFTRRGSRPRLGGQSTSSSSVSELKPGFLSLFLVFSLTWSEA